MNPIAPRMKLDLGQLGMFFVAVGAICATIGAFLNYRDQTRNQNLLNLKNEEIIRLTQNALSSVTGGTNFPSLEIGDRDTDHLAILVGSGDTFPLYDVRVQILDLDTAEKTQDFIGKTVTVGELPANSVYPIGKLTVIGMNAVRLNVFFSARNGRLSQEVRLKKIEGQWQLASRVLDTMGTNILKLTIDPKFPLEANGAVKWD